MSPEISSKSNHASSIPGVESGPVDAPNNEAPAQAGPLAEVNQRRGAGTEPEESSQCDGANAAPPKTNEVTSSADEQSAAGLLLEGHAAQKTESISAGGEPAVSTAKPSAVRHLLVTGDDLITVLGKTIELVRAQVSMLDRGLAQAERRSASNRRARTPGTVERTNGQ